MLLNACHTRLAFEAVGIGRRPCWCAVALRSQVAGAVPVVADTSYADVAAQVGNGARRGHGVLGAGRFGGRGFLV